MSILKKYSMMFITANHTTAHLIQTDDRGVDEQLMADRDPLALPSRHAPHLMVSLGGEGGQGRVYKWRVS
jgi:hypothetical protein